MNFEDINFDNSIEFAIELDNNDELKTFRKRFHFPKDKNGNETVYFTGNSLGLQPKTTREFINQELDDWAKFGVEGHFHAKNPWMPYHEFVTEKLANIVGALPSEVVAMNSLTVNLHLMMVSFYRPTIKKRKIIIANNEFPSDIYAVKSQLKFHNFNKNEDLIIAKAKDGSDIISTEEILEIIRYNAEETCLLMFAGVNYYTGQYFDIKRITEECHKYNIISGFDLAHAAGNVPVRLHDWNVDFAVWCSYKYLNSGPGGIAGAFVHERHKDFTGPRFEGWWGTKKDTRFLMKPNFEAISGVEAWQLSNPPIFQLAALNSSLEIFEEVGMEQLREKSEKLTGYLEYLLGTLPSEKISIITPKDKNQRGCQLSIRVSKGKEIFNILINKGVIADWREPDVIRVAPVPLYNSFEDVFKFYQILKEEI
jgi:kynureninase